MKLLTRLLASVLALGCTFHAHAEWPERPIRIVLPVTPGNSSDVAFRLVGEKLAQQLGQPVLVENRAGASGVIATNAVAQSNPDGYTLGLGSPGPITILRWQREEPLPYDGEKDFVAVSAIAWAPQVVVTRKEVPVQNFKEFVAHAKRSTSPLRFGTQGVGTTTHLVISQMLHQTGMQADHIPYQGGAAAVMGLLGGDLDFVSDNVPLVQSFLVKGQLKALGVTSGQRIPTLPDVPTLAEQGLDGFDLQGWILLLAPAKTPEPVLRKLGDAVDGIMKMPDVRKRLTDLGLIPMDMPRAQLAGFVSAETRKWREVVRLSGSRDASK